MPSRRNHDAELDHNKRFHATVVFDASFASSTRVRRLFCLALLLSVLSACHQSRNPQQDLDHTRQIFIHGDLFKSQEEAERGYKRFAKSDPSWAVKFKILEAETLMWRGMYEQALTTLNELPQTPDSQSAVSILAINALAHTRLHDFEKAQIELTRANKIARRMLCRCVEP